MGKYMKEEVEKAFGDPEHHYRFAARLNWTGHTLEDPVLKNLADFVNFVGDEHINSNWFTGIHKKTLQGYFLKKFDSVTCKDFVIIGLQHPAKENSLCGLEMFCFQLIFNTLIKGAFYQAVEANDLKKVHGPKLTD